MILIHIIINTFISFVFITDYKLININQSINQSIITVIIFPFVNFDYLSVYNIFLIFFHSLSLSSTGFHHTCLTPTTSWVPYLIHDTSHFDVTKSNTKLIIMFLRLHWLSETTNETESLILVTPLWWIKSQVSSNTWNSKQSNCYRHLQKGYQVLFKLIEFFLNNWIITKKKQALFLVS